MSFEQRLLQFVHQQTGVVIFRKQVAQLAAPTEVSRGFQRLVTTGVLFRLGAGVYAKSKRDELTNALTLAAEAEAIAREVMERLARPQRGHKPSSLKHGLQPEAQTKWTWSGTSWVYLHDRVKGRALAVIAFTNPKLRGSTIPSDSVSGYVAELARRHGVRYSRVFADQWSEHAARLAGDDVQADHTEDLLVALRRARKVDDIEMASLLASHLREKKRVRSLQGL